jgi:endonuclease/exonuclease/phosphatase family metal-dependent hydrolase
MECGCCGALPLTAEGACMKLKLSHLLFTVLAMTMSGGYSAKASRSDGGKEQLSLAQFNLRWFGSKEHNTSQNKAASNESRIQTIRKHMTDSGLMADVLAFEEIVDVKLLSDVLLEKRYNCYSYNHKDPEHQHVVVCVKPHLKFEKAPGSKSYTLDEVDLNGELRPAVHGIVKTSGGKAVMHLFAVHLKSAPDFSSTRLRQMEVISKYIKRDGEILPVTIVGDFNTYGDDPENFSRILAGSQMEEVPSPEKFSWATTHESYEPAKFDRAWITGTLADKVSFHHIIGPCNQSDRRTLQRYNDTVSDHCAVKTVFNLD